MGIVRAAASGARVAKNTRRHNAEVASLFRERRTEKNAKQRDILTKRLWRALRAERRLHLNLVLQVLKGQGKQIMDKALQKLRWTIPAALSPDGRRHVTPEGI